MNTEKINNSSIYFFVFYIYHIDRILYYAESISTQNISNTTLSIFMLIQGQLQREEMENIKISPFKNIVG
jgi:hypothetical protein